VNPFVPLQSTLFGADGQPMMPFRTDVGHLAAQLPDALLRIDDDGRLTWRNLEFRELTEGDGPNLLGRSLRHLAHPQDRGIVEAALTAVADGALKAEAHIRARLADGTWSEAQILLRRTPTFEGHPGFVSGLLRIVGP
jgi:PAS domain-containing protein